MRLQQIAVLAQMLLVHVEAVNVKYIKAGSCGGGICKLESTSCDDPEVFKDTRTTAHHHHTDGCDHRGATDDVKIGYCGGDTPAFCTSVKENCKDEGSFVPNYSGCTVKSQSSRFGSCKGHGILCVWGPDDCGKVHNFIPAYKNKDLCKATDVQTGACMFQKEASYCGVSSNGCNGSFKSIEDLALDGNFDCRLALPMHDGHHRFPTPAPPKSFKANSKRMCDHHVAIDFFKEEVECDLKCDSVESCVAYQVTLGVGCTLFSGTNTFKSGDKFSDFDCREKKSKKKNQICDPRGMISLVKGSKLSKCKKACKNDKKCKYHMLVKNNNCLLLGKTGEATKSKKYLMKKFTCHTSS